MQVLIVLALVGSGVICTTAQAETDKATMIGSRPDSGDAPMVVTVNAFVVDVISVSDVDQAFTVDVYFTAEWRDPRLRGETTRTLALGEIWDPKLGIVNERSLDALLPEVATVEPDGSVTSTQRVIGELGARMNLRDFPFDTQILTVDLVSYGYSPGEVELRPKAKTTNGLESFSASGWRLQLGRAYSEPLVIPAIGEQRSQVKFEIDAERDADYHRWTMYVPLVFIVLMAWMVFWIDPSLIPSQIGLSTASVFTLIAFRFSLRLALPAVSYMTQLDKFLLGCTVLVFLALGQAVFTGRLVKQERETLARSMDAWGRWIYLALFIVLSVTVGRIV
jgi:hypothetical protein